MTVVRALRRPTEENDDDNSSSTSTIDLSTLDAAVALLVRLRERVLSSLEAEGKGEEEARHVGRLLVEEDARGR